MKRNNITLERPERFTTPFTIPKEKLEAAANEALRMLRKMGEEGGVAFPNSGAGFRYSFDENKSWTHGMYAGCYWLAYELSGDKWFLDMAEALTATFRKRLDDKVGMDDHDVGFAFTPSCVAKYVYTGDKDARQTALDACEYFYDKSYSKEGKFIIRAWKYWNQGTGCRTMMDSLMNAPLLFWAAKETGNEDYFNAALDHVKTTEEHLIRADGSSFHHFQFDPETAKPVRGLTFQGNRDESCWSRGHSWGVYGFAVAYSYTKEEFIKDVHKDISYFMLNHLPEDFVPAWDYDFTSNKAVKDSSSGVISACGLYEMASMLPDESPDKEIFRNAANRMLNAIIDDCTGDNGIPDRDGLIFHVTPYASAPKPEQRSIDRIATYGDYFYLEALLRALKPDFKNFW